MELLGNSMKWLAELESPPFDDPAYVKRCNDSWRADYKREMDRLRERWLSIIAKCLEGGFGRHSRDDWQSSYPGVNPDTLGNLALMQAAQAVWACAGKKCLEKMPMLKTMAGHVCPDARQLPVDPRDDRDDYDFEQSSFAGM